MRTLMECEGTRFDHALKVVSSVQNYQDLSTVLHTLREIYGVANLGYHALQIDEVEQRELPIFATCDQAWIKHYVDRELIEIDPIAKASKQTSLPIDWASVDRRSTDAKLYFSELSRYEIGRQGMGIPIHGSHGSAIFTFTAHINDTADWRSFRFRNKPELALLAHYIHERTVSLVKGRSAKAFLSKQEKTCLQLSAEGHNALATANILGLSVHTVRMHLSRAQKRLHVQSRTEAVAKAVSQGLIRNKRRVLFLAFAMAFDLVPYFEIPASSFLT